MTQWTYARIDRFESGEVRCIFCNRALRSGRLIVLKGEVGSEAYAGAACAKKHVGAPTEPLLDLSKIALRMVVKEIALREPGGDDPSAKAASKAESKLIPPQLDEATQYIRLRVEHMEKFAGNTTDRLRQFHTQLHSAEGLGESERLYVVRLLAKSKANNTTYSLRNVERCIGAAYWLRIAIEHTKIDRRDFLEGMLRSLREHWRLSAKQIDAINRWGEGVRQAVSDFPVLDASAFDGVHTPRFAAPQNKRS